jgi:hypothetical protein
VTTHPSAWFTSLASRLGHPGYVTLTEVIEAEQEQGPGQGPKA